MTTPEVEAWKDPYWLKLKGYIKTCIEGDSRSPDGYVCMSCDMNVGHLPRKHDDDCFLLETEAFILKMLNSQTALQSRVKELELKLEMRQSGCWHGDKGHSCSLGDEKFKVIADLESQLSEMRGAFNRIIEITKDSETWAKAELCSQIAKEALSPRAGEERENG